jgi:hypothetical protein
VRPALDRPRLGAVAGAAVLTLVPGACSGGQQVRTSTTTTKQGRVYSLSYSNHTGDGSAKADALVELAREIAGRV